jgi:hypothetical protein
MTPTARTLNLLRRSGYLAAVVETWIPRINRRRDLFRFADVFAVHPVRREIVLVQTTTAGHLAQRLAKVRGIPELPAILASGVKVSVHGWARCGGSWHPRIVEVIAADLQPVTVADLPRSPRAWKQALLFADPGAGPYAAGR